MLALSGCGLESFILLRPPLAIRNADNDKFEFQTTIDNIELEFQGFEVYYKIFPTTVPSPQNYYITFEDMLADSYRRLNNPNFDKPGIVNRPLLFIDGPPIPNDRGDILTVTIDFSASLAATDEYPKITVTGAPQLDGPETTVLIDEARRSVPKTGFNEFKKFTEFEASDVLALGSDVTAEVLAEIQNFGVQVGLVCFAVSWGIDPVGNLIVYSQPEWLGYESIDFP